MAAPSPVVEVLVSGALFIAVWRVIGVGLLKPFFEMLEKREAQTHGAEANAGKGREKIVSLKAKIEDMLRSSRLEGIAARDKVVFRAKEEANEIMGGALAAAQSELEGARREIAELKKKALVEAGAEAQGLAEVVLSRVLKPGQSPTVH